MFGLFESNMSDTDLGRQAVTYFHNESTNYSAYNETLHSLQDRIADGKSPVYFLEGLGLAIRMIDMSDSQVRQAMEKLAHVYQGQIPRREAFHGALSDRISNPTFGDYVGATPQVAIETAGDVVKGAQAVGNAVIDTGKTLLQFGPILIVAAVIFIGYAYTRRVAGR